MIAAIETTILCLFEKRYLLACDKYGVLYVYGWIEGRKEGLPAPCIQGRDDGLHGEGNSL